MSNEQERKVPIENELIPLAASEDEADSEYGGLVQLTSEQIQQLDVAVDNFKKIVGIACRLTTPNDWVDQGGKPYLQASGAEKIANPFGVIISNKEKEKHERKDEKGSYYFYEYRCRIYSRLLNRSIEAEGYRSSRDPFFALARGEVVPQSEIDESEVMRAAYSNMTVNAITRLIGIRNLTWEMVESFGIKRSQVASINYDRGFKSNVPAGETASSVEDKRVKIGEWLMALNGDDKAAASRHLEELTTFRGKDGKEVRGKKALSDLSAAAIPVIYGKVKELAEKAGKV
jgi:hypothetical protein